MTRQHLKNKIVEYANLSVALAMRGDITNTGKTSFDADRLLTKIFEALDADFVESTIDAEETHG